MRHTRDIHTMCNPSGPGWVNWTAGHVLATYQSQREAAESGRALAITLRCTHVVHGQDGRISERESFGASEELWNSDGVAPA